MASDDFNAYKPWYGSGWEWRETKRAKCRSWKPAHVWQGLLIRERRTHAGFTRFEVKFLNGKTHTTDTLAKAQEYAEQWAHQQIE